MSIDLTIKLPSSAKKQKITVTAFRKLSSSNRKNQNSKSLYTYIIRCLPILLTLISYNNKNIKDIPTPCCVTKPPSDLIVAPINFKPKIKPITNKDRLLQYVKIGNYHKVYKLIVDSGFTNLDYQDKEGNTALHIASLIGQQDIIELLLDRGASMAIQNKEGNTPSHILLIKHHDNILSELIWLRSERIKNSVNVQNDEGNTPLDIVYMDDDLFLSYIHEDLLSIGASESFLKIQVGLSKNIDFDFIF